MQCDIFFKILTFVSNKLVFKRPEHSSNNTLYYYSWPQQPLLRHILIKLLSLQKRQKLFTVCQKIFDHTQDKINFLSSLNKNLKCKKWKKIWERSYIWKHCTLYLPSQPLQTFNISHLHQKLWKPLKAKNIFTVYQKN